MLIIPLLLLLLALFAGWLWAEARGGRAARISLRLACLLVLAGGTYLVGQDRYHFGRPFLLWWLCWVLAGTALFAAVASLLAYRRAQRRVYLAGVALGLVVALTSGFLGVSMPGMEPKQVMMRVVFHREPFDFERAKFFEPGTLHSLIGASLDKVPVPIPFDDKNVEEFEEPFPTGYRNASTGEIVKEQPPDYIHRFNGTGENRVDFLIKDGKIWQIRVGYKRFDPGKR
ncbi:MAG TPA: hypothetical protein VNK04_13850 [Gemmataceae bacterium]|nr:hypothetical protein [Gemmataceae bacterium]